MKCEREIFGWIKIKNGPTWYRTVKRAKKLIDSIGKERLISVFEESYKDDSRVIIVWYWKD